MSEQALAPAAREAHPFLRRRIFVPLLLVLLAVHLPFLHYALRGSREVAAAVPFSDDFDRAQIGDRYWSNGGFWRIADGWLYSPGVQNNPLWLKARLPADVRLEFDVKSEGADGDVKCELFGDGRNHASGYVFIFGGWHNRESRIARLDEHALTERELRNVLAARKNPYPRNVSGLEAVVDALQRPFESWQAGRDLDALDAGRYYGKDTPFAVMRSELKVERGRTYHFAISRKGALIDWEIDGKPVLEMKDAAPLSGAGHDRFGFSSWMNDTYFAHLRITPL